LPQCAAGFGAELELSKAANRWRISVARGKSIARPSELCNETPRPHNDELEIIEQLLGMALDAINRKTPDVRLADVLKLLEFKHRLKPQADVRAVFWEWIEHFRREAARGDDSQVRQPGVEEKK
jgi:hypothetical protein